MGIWLAADWDWPLSIWLMMGALGFASGILQRRHERTRMALIGLAAVGFGGARYTTAVPHINESHIAHYNDSQKVTLTGLVIDEPDTRDRFVNLRVAIDSIALGDGAVQPVHGVALVRTFRYPVIEYGTRLEMNGRLETPPEWEDFSYKDYLARQNVHSLINTPQLTVLAENEGRSLTHAILAFKARAQATINRLIPDPQAALLSGILLGNDNGISPDLAEAFRITGMTHIIAISGFNIAILIAILVRVSESFLSRRGAVIFAIVGITFYTILVGADASVVRAAIMGGIYLIANRLLGRPNFAYASLFLAGFIMTLHNPFALWDVGFQLSFAATLGLMLYADPFARWTRRRLLRRFDRKTVRAVMGLITESILITLAAQVLTLPLMMAYFGQLSLISLPANALILPAQPGVMVWGGLATLSGMVVPAIGQLFGWITWLFLAYTIGLVRLFAAVPGATVPIEISTTGIIAIYILISAITWLTKQEPEKRARITAVLRQNFTQKAALGTSLLAAILTVGWSATQPDGNLHIVFIDVGQGDATFIQTPSGRQILVDGGYYPSVLNDELGRQMPFWDKEIDLMVATHPDADHISGLPGVFERYRVGQLITNGQGLGESPIYDAVLQAAQTAETPIRRALAGETIVIEDGVQLEILHPGAELLPNERNENSVSMQLVYGDLRFVLTGDAEERGEKAILARNVPLEALVYKAGHHGSNSSSGMPFLEAIRPQIIIISVGADNNFGHPAPEMLQRAADVGAVVLRTDELGTIEMITDGRVLWQQARP
ncbi:MAG: DNA internalization-related competence protein ComEC/Rec2 [Chloroflexi bacterium]|nr:DNA internalization-related competence protein ComEC/Rec2 [Chloroflexota bacterium]